jgi:hypothetical protein
MNRLLNSQYSQSFEPLQDVGGFVMDADFSWFLCEIVDKIVQFCV